MISSRRLKKLTVRLIYFTGLFAVDNFNNLVAQQDSVHVFVDLVKRHEQSFYNFVHKVHSKGEGLFDGLINWIELFVGFMRDGFGEPVNLEFLLPHAGPDRVNILREVDAVALYHYRLKVAYESKIRRRFAREGGSGDDEDDEATQALVDDVVKGLSFGELIEAEDLAAEESSDESGSEDGSEYETDSYEETSLSISHSGPRPMQSTPSLKTQISYCRPQATIETDLPPPLPPKDPHHLQRKQPMSLRSSKSSTDLRHKRIHSKEVPPVPPLPSNIAALSLVDHMSPHSKPSVSSSPSSHSDRTPAEVEMTRERSAPHPIRSKKPTRPASEIKAPDLKELPNLVPLFVEMVSFSHYYSEGWNNVSDRYAQTCNRDRFNNIILHFFFSND